MQVEVRIEINRKLEDIFAYITDFEKNPKWQKGMVSCTFSTEPPLRVGSQYQQIATFLGQDILSKFEVTAYIPNKRIEFETIESTFPIQIMREVTAKENSTEVHAIIRGQPNGLMRLFTPLVKIMMTQQIQNDYQRLKTLLEAESG